MTNIKTLKHWKLFANCKLKIANSEYGGAIVMVLVFAGVFVVAVGSLMQFVLQQSVSGRGKVAREQSLQIAEAGLEYYKWHLAHNTLQDSEVRTVEYTDPSSGQRIGEFTISSTANKQCGDIMNRDIEVIGSADIDTRFSRTISSRYMKPSVANYSYVIGADVWAGSTRDIIGPYHSEGGIRMDGTHNSLVTSSVSSWNCTGSFGCSPTQTKAGVWGAGSNPELWQYPKSEVSFANIAPNFADLKSKAQSVNRYFYSVSNGVGDKGYHIIFKSNGTFDMYQVNSSDYNWSWWAGEPYNQDYHTILSETFLGNYTIPSTCSLIFVEDQVWVEGVVSGKVALVAADLVNSYDPDIVLHDNLTYATGPDTDGISIIAENSVLVSTIAPEDLTVSGIFVAVNGKFGRYFYVKNPGWYWDYGISDWKYLSGVGNSQELDTFTVIGSVVSKARASSHSTYTVYKSGSGWLTEEAGFTSRVNSYERVQAFDPPPFSPGASTTPYLVNWREE